MAHIAHRQKRPEPLVQSRSTRTSSEERASLLLRWLCHSVAISPIAVVAVVELARGWRPTSDDAVLAWRTLEVFSRHLPLVGQFTQATVANSHPIFDLGPLQYFLLAVPVRIDPAHGLLWGSVVLAAGFMSLAIEAVWATGARLGAVAVAAAFTTILATQTGVGLNLAWNPDLGVLAFASTIVVAAVSATGRLRWWAVACGTASFAAQTNLVFVAPAGGCLLAGLALGVVARRRAHALRAWPAVLGGVAVILVCFAAPLLQQLTSSAGNLSALADSLDSPRRTLGLSFALKGLDSVTRIPPAWWQRTPTLGATGGFGRFLRTVFGGSTTGGVIAVALTFAVATGALVTRRRGLAGLAACAALSALGVTWAISSIQTSQLGVVTYLDVALWPVGIAADVSIAWGFGELAMAVAATWRRGVVRPDDSATGPGRHREIPLAAAGVLTVCLLGLSASAIVGLVPAASTERAVIGGWAVSRAIPSIAGEIAATGPRGPIVIDPTVPLLPAGLADWSAVEGVAYALASEGYDVRLPSVMALEVGSNIEPARGGLAFRVIEDRSGRYRAIAGAPARMPGVFGYGTSRS